MLRILVAIGLMLAVGQTSGMPWLDDCCDESDCGDSKQCPPDCPTCTCAPTATPSLPTVHATITPVILDECVVEFVADQTLALPPDPREILHVPRSLTV